MKEELSKLFLFSDFPASANLVRDILKDRKIICYGAGSGYLTFAQSILFQYGYKAELIIDSKFSGNTTFDGVAATSLSDYYPSKEELDNSIVVITVGNSKLYGEIIDCLQKKGFKNIVAIHDIYEFSHFFPEELQKCGYNFYLKNKENIFDAFELLEDAESREIFLGFLKTHILRTPIEIPSNQPEDQYFPHDIKICYTHIINGGSYDGDTIKILNSKIGKVDSIICFEPELDNYRLLTRYIRNASDRLATNIVAFPCGLFSESKQLRFNQGKKNNSVISDGGNGLIQCVALDDAIPTFKPTFINMDIEGAEVEALKGAKNIILKNKPDLAICVYHCPNHIWEIPLFLDELRLNYKFYLRNYSGYTNDTVLYAVGHN